MKFIIEKRNDLYVYLETNKQVSVEKDFTFLRVFSQAVQPLADPRGHMRLYVLKHQKKKTKKCTRKLTLFNPKRIL